jgi:hypothetical protein
LKIDKHLKGLSDRLNAVSASGDNGNGNDSNVLTDDYYLAIGSEPPRFMYYRHVRAEEWQALGHKLWDHVYDHRITQDELDYYLKKKLRVSPEQRYQYEKQDWFFHELSYLDQTVDENGKAVDIIKESGCGHWSTKREEKGGCCVPECRFYSKYGRIEDEEVIAEHNKAIKLLTEQNAIIQPPDMNSKEAYAFFQERPWA